MSDDVKDAIDYLQACGLANISRGSMWDVEMCKKTISVIDRLKAEVERLTLVWSSERPKVAGLYIVRVEPAPGLWHSQWFEEWSEDDVTGGRLWFAGHEFAGPIAVREPARGEEDTP